MSTPTVRVNPFKRIAYSFLGLIAGDAVLLALFAISQLLDLFVLYGMFSLAGWVLVGIPVALAVPGRLVARLPWLLLFVIGAVLGPLALFLIFVLLNGRHISRLSFAHTESLWPFSILIAAVAFFTYGLLIRREVRRKVS